MMMMRSPTDTLSAIGATCNKRFLPITTQYLELFLGAVLRQENGGNTDGSAENTEE